MKQYLGTKSTVETNTPCFELFSPMHVFFGGVIYPNRQQVFDLLSIPVDTPNPLVNIPKFKDWLLKIKDKLAINKDHYLIAALCLTYIKS
jgi:hypothetical protein